MHGKGLYTWKDGRKYDGEYHNDKKVMFYNLINMYTIFMFYKYKSMDLEFIYGQMDAGMKENGDQESKNIYKIDIFY